MAITALPAPPTRSDPATFAIRADAFMLALPTFVTEANALQTDVTTKQTDVATRQSDVISRQTDVTTKQSDIISRQTDVTTKQSDVTTKQLAAAASASAAAASATAADTTKRAIDAKYLGSKATAPTVDNEGNALTQGAEYFNTTDQKKYIRGTSSWILSAYDITVAGAAIGSANVPDYVVKRDNTGSFAGQIITAQDFNTLSDRHLKTNIQYNIDGLSNLRVMLPASWNWKKDGKKSYGMIAQELRITHPELVMETENNVLSINYIPIIGFLVDAVQKLEAEIDMLKSK